MRFSGKTVYITEASSAVGEALALPLCLGGREPGVWAIGQADLFGQGGWRSWAQRPWSCRALPCSPTSGAEARLAEEVLKTFGRRVDALIFNNNNGSQDRASSTSTREPCSTSQLNDNAQGGLRARRAPWACTWASYGTAASWSSCQLHPLTTSPRARRRCYSVAKGGITMLCKECRALLRPPAASSPT